MIKLLNKEICLVCCYFNPCNYKSRFLNFLSFINSARQRKINLLVVEAYSRQSTYRINNIWNSVISVATEELYWTKEMLLNIGIKTLVSEGVANIGWVDCDILFTDDDFQKNILHKLKKYNIVQNFSECKKITADNSHYTTTSVCKLASKDKNLLNLLLTRYGDVGYGYTYNSDILRQARLYDKAIVGTGDWLNILGGIPLENKKELYNDRFFRGSTIDFFNSYISWHTSMSKCINNSIGYAENKIVILNHGYEKNRQYVSRESILKNNLYNPNTDLIYEKTIPRLTNKKLKIQIFEYFKSRHEDEAITPAAHQFASNYLEQHIFYDTHGNELEIKTVDSYVKKTRAIKSVVYTGVSDKKTNKFQHIPTTTNTHTVVISRHTHSKFLHNSDQLNIKSFRKQGKLLRNDLIVLSEPESPTHTYLTYIVDTYYDLSDILVFITDEHQEIEPTEEQLVNLIDNSECGFEVIGKINTKMSDEQRQTINNWIADNIPELIIDFSIVSNSYITSKNNIQKHEIDLYEKLKKLYEQIPPPHDESVFNLLLGSLIK